MFLQPRQKGSAILLLILLGAALMPRLPKWAALGSCRVAH